MCVVDCAFVCTFVGSAYDVTLTIHQMLEIQPVLIVHLRREFVKEFTFFKDCVLIYRFFLFEVRNTYNPCE